MCFHLFVSLLLVGLTASESDDTVTLPASCIGLEDGLQYLQPLSNVAYDSVDDSASSPIVEARCSKGYTIIDPNFESSWESLFSSFHSYHASYSGPDLNDHVTWKEWFLPSVADDGMIFGVSEDCNECETDLDSLEYGDETTYYMTGDSYGCNWLNKKICDFDVETLECRTCVAPGSITGEETYGKCGHMPTSSSNFVYEDHSACSGNEGTTIPSIGMTSKYCICYKPSVEQNNIASMESYNAFLDDRNRLKQADSAGEDEAEVEVHLTQDDFMKGTYRITQPGTYIIDEDIEFDFNAGDLRDPNAPGAWYPTADQSDEYPGAGENDGWYWLGFFAGIAVECADVTIDLNGHELKMSPALYIQQRWFTVIELASKPFVDGQGPTWTGTGIKYTKNTVVKNGIIGLTSHAGIHGNNVTNVIIENVHVKDFETHGIGVNEFDGLTIRNVEIGPSMNGQLGLNGDYSTARLLLPVFRAAAEELDLHDDQTITFAGHSDESYTMRELVEELEDQMNMMFRWAYFGEEGSSDTWETAYELFANPTGDSYGGVVYGLLLRSRGASIVNWAEWFDGPSSNLVLDNVEIHDLVLAMDEVLAISRLGKTNFVHNTFNGPVTFKLATHNKMDPLENSIYTGSALTNCIIALRKLSNNWWHLGRTSISDSILTWAESGRPFEEIVSGECVKCNFDTLAHVPKGVAGIRAEYIDNAQINDLRIYNLMNVGKLGSDLCGNYTRNNDGGNSLQAYSFSPGYGGTPTRAISMYGVTNSTMEDVFISTIMSLNGPAYGLYFINNTEVELVNFKVKHVHSGIALFEDYSQNVWPNVAAEACAISWMAEGQITDSEHVESSCVTGHRLCSRCESFLGTGELSSCSGEIVGCQESVSYQTVFGTYGVDRFGQIYQRSVDEDTDIVVDQKNTGYISIIDNMHLFATSPSVQKQRIIYYGNNGNMNKDVKNVDKESKSSSGGFGYVLTRVTAVLVAVLVMYLMYTRKMANSEKSGYKLIGGLDKNESECRSIGACDYRGDKTALLKCETVL